MPILLPAPHEQHGSLLDAARPFRGAYRQEFRMTVMIPKAQMLHRAAAARGAPFGRQTVAPSSIKRLIKVTGTVLRRDL